MKTSIYNNFISLTSGKVLAYNAFSDQFALISSSCFETLQENKLSSKDILTDDFEKLIKGGFILDNDIDQQLLLQKETNSTSLDETVFQIHINPTLDCNFRCWYCYEEHGVGTEMTGATMESVILFIEKHLTSKTKIFVLGFFGGEPLLKFKKICLPIIQAAKKACETHNIRMELGFTSNGFLLTENIANIIAQYNGNVQITLDGHREFHNAVRHTASGQGSYDQILSNVVIFNNTGGHITLRINYTLDNITSIDRIVEDLCSKSLAHPEQLTVDFQRVWQDKPNGGDEIINVYISKAIHKLSKHRISHRLCSLINPRLELCYGDRANYVCINYNGDIFGCTARNFAAANRLGVLTKNGDIEWETEKHHRWLNSRFARESCHACRIAPICLGGCRQRSYETSDNEICPMGYSDEDKNNRILFRFEKQFIDKK